MKSELPLYSVSVRDLVAFAWRSGDLAGKGGFSGRSRALEGTRGQTFVQKQRKGDYQVEVPVEKLIETEELKLLIRGRMDGLRTEKGTLLVEEIKTVRSGPILAPELLHTAQARLYAYLFAEGKQFDSIEIQVTYLELGSRKMTEFKTEITWFELEAFYQQTVDEYLRWIRAQQQWRLRRDASIEIIQFPHGQYRPGQRRLAVAVYKTIRSGGKLFAEAPTGIGKTVSVLFPAIKALRAGAIEKVFYLTAKTSGRAVAENTLKQLREKGLLLRSVTITARDKICFKPGAAACDPKTCPYAIGYYDRVKGAVRAALELEQMGRSEIEQVARSKMVCPHELSLDAAEWADLVICDYNYVFDPSAKLKRFFAEEPKPFAILADESHNLIERSREMFSAGIAVAELENARQALAGDAPACSSALRSLRETILQVCQSESFIPRGDFALSKAFPKELLQPLDQFLDAAEQWLALEEPALFREMLLDLYFSLLGFEQIAGLYGEQYATLWNCHEQRLRLFCLDASAFLAEALEGRGSAIFFSATLRPNAFFREALGGLPTDSIIELTSPFDPNRLRLLVHGGIATNWREREASLAQVAEAISAVALGRPGNYIAYFPSYQYLASVREKLESQFPQVRTIIQEPGMSDQRRENFLERFQAQTQSVQLGMAVMGGVFGEGIDLVGERLAGVIVVGVGLPQLSLERDLIKEYYARQRKSGFDFAYTFPGMTKVLQAAGRVIRSETDRGVVLLIDQRFGRHAYRSLFPPWWEPRVVGSAEEISAELNAFWGDSQAGQL
jgi:DNA excision repair protein ERCC-2